MMPPKRNIKKGTSVKQIREIKSRLMLISFKVDDYIYKKVPMPATDAHNFQQEIRSYKEICHDDVRSMQVVDKLTRLLQKIIEEQTVFEEVRSKNNCGVSNDDSTPLRNITDTQSTDIDKATQETDERKINKPTIEKENNNTEDKFDNFEVCIHKPHLNDNTNIKQSISINISLDNGDSEHALCSNEANNTQIIGEKKMYLEKANSEPYNTRSPHKKKKTKQYIETFEEQISSKKSNNVTKKPRRNNTDDVKKTSQKSLHISNALKTQNQPVSKKVQNSVIDLSWVENIKYVREIEPEEFDPKLKDISDAFWQNCTFPRDWDESDFLTE